MFEDSGGCCDAVRLCIISVLNAGWLHRHKAHSEASDTLDIWERCNRRMYSRWVIRPTQTQRQGVNRSKDSIADFWGLPFHTTYHLTQPFISPGSALNTIVATHLPATE